MEFNVSQLLKSVVGTVRRYEMADSLADIEDVAWVAPGEGTVEMTRTNRGILVRAQIESAASSICSRCLETFAQPLTVEFEEEFLPTVEVDTGVPIPIEDADAHAFVIDERHTLDLREAIRQYALLGLPMQPICQPDCAGLCPQCGANLNLGQCDCPPEVDQRWEALVTLASASGRRKE